MKIAVFTVCYNEMYIAPFVVDYWKRYADHVYVFDDGSNDGTREYLQKFPFITIKTNDNTSFDDNRNMILKNSIWKDYKNEYDFVQVSDFDEVLYCQNGIKTQLQKIYPIQAIFKSMTYECVSRQNVTYSKEKLLHQLDGVYQAPSFEMCKNILFNPKLVKEINYGFGCHSCFPEFASSEVIPFFENYDIKMFHLKYLGKEHILENFNKMYNRFNSSMPEIIKGHYRQSSEDIETIIENYLKHKTKFYE